MSVRAVALAASSAQKAIMWFCLLALFQQSRSFLLPAKRLFPLTSPLLMLLSRCNCRFWWNERLFSSLLPFKCFLFSLFVFIFLSVSLFTLDFAFASSTATTTIRLNLVHLLLAGSWKLEVGRSKLKAGKKLNTTQRVTFTSERTGHAPPTHRQVSQVCPALAGSGVKAS